MRAFPHAAEAAQESARSLGLRTIRQRPVRPVRFVAAPTELRRRHPRPLGRRPGLRPGGGRRGAARSGYESVGDSQRSCHAGGAPLRVPQRKRLRCAERENSERPGL